MLWCGLLLLCVWDALVCCADVLLAAVRELAGPDQPKLFPSAVLVANTLKVIQTLEQIGEQLQVREGHTGPGRDIDIGGLGAQPLGTCRLSGLPLHAFAFQLLGRDERSQQQSRLARCVATCAQI